MPDRRLGQLAAIAAVTLAVAAVWWYARGVPAAPTPVRPSPPIVSPVPPGPTPISPAPRPPPPRPPAPAALPAVEVAWLDDVDERAAVVAVAQAIDRGGPFRYRKDGAVFENREGRLPARPRGYWREYTVPTPDEDDRGARRLVGGQRHELYYTRDHYRSFMAIRGAVDAAR
ncbi:MAG: ribonuclease domain-containing protein [Kofleriaceae bacterium]